MTVDFIGPEAESVLSWQGIIAALEAGHSLPKAEIADLFLYRDKDTMLDRAAWITGLGSLVKVATVHPGNAALGLPTINGVVTLYNDKTGLLDALLDFHLITKWKTAGDSLLAASKLARKDAKAFLLVGAGNVARNMVQAYSALFPDARFEIWNRSPDGAARFAASDARITVAPDLEAAVKRADVICTATMSKQPLIKGAWLQAGQHLDLIGAYTAAMREVDDEAMQRASVFVDSRATTLHHIGELMAPLASGAIAEADVKADYYDMASGAFQRDSADQITLSKNGGGAHLDLMTAAYVLEQWRNR
ncbi:MAG: ornithine cyclodeaminase family protein [Cypionkella sp.]